MIFIFRLDSAGAKCNLSANLCKGYGNGPEQLFDDSKVAAVALAFGFGIRFAA